VIITINSYFVLASLCICEVNIAVLGIANVSKNITKKSVSIIVNQIIEHGRVVTAMCNTVQQQLAVPGARKKLSLYCRLEEHVATCGVYNDDLQLSCFH